MVHDALDMQHAAGCIVAFDGKNTRKYHYVRMYVCTLLSAFIQCSVNCLNTACVSVVVH